MPHTAAHSAMSADMKKCSEECLSCSTTCTETVHHCLHMGGKHVEPAHLTSLIDCAEICQTSANFLLRGSSLHTETCRTCAAVCRACEASCRQIEGEEMKRCADACGRCAESCERMAAMAS